MQFAFGFRDELLGLFKVPPFELVVRLLVVELGQLLIHLRRETQIVLLEPFDLLACL